MDGVDEPWPVVDGRDDLPPAVAQQAGEALAQEERLLEVCGGMPPHARISTTPVVPLTRMRSPVLMRSPASLVPTTVTWTFCVETPPA